MTGMSNGTLVTRDATYYCYEHYMVSQHHGLIYGELDEKDSYHGEVGLCRKNH